jgi:hypothetical protein
LRPKGLRLIEVDKDDLVHLPEIVELIAGRRERFIIFLRRPVFRVGRARLQGDEEHPRRLDHRHARQPAGVCDVQPPPPDAGKDVGKPRNQVQRSTATSTPARPPRRRFRSPSASGFGFRSTPSARTHYLEICAHWLAEFGMRGG